MLTNINKRTLNSYFGKFYWNFDKFILTSHSGFTYRLVKWSTEIFNQLSSICKLQVSNLRLGTLNGIFSATITRALDTRKLFKAVNWISSVLIPKQKKQKVLVGSKSMRCEAQIARFWLLRSRVSQSLCAHSQTCKHWGREWAKYLTDSEKKNCLTILFSFTSGPYISQLPP